MWRNLAASPGDEDAKTNFDIATEQMTPDQLAQAKRMAREGKPLAER